MDLVILSEVLQVEVVEFLKGVSEYPFLPMQLVYWMDLRLTAHFVVGEEVEAMIDKEVEEQVADRLQKHIPPHLRDMVDAHKKQLDDVTRNLHNVYVISDTCFAARGILIRGTFR